MANKSTLIKHYAEANGVSDDVYRYKIEVALIDPLNNNKNIYDNAQITFFRNNVRGRVSL